MEYPCRARKTPYDREAFPATLEAIREADGLLIATPEYNHGVPAVTKNAIDWASRPAKNAPLNEKPVGILGASPGMTGSARGQSQLRQAFEFTNSYCMPQPEILVYRAHQKFDEDGNLTDEATRKFLGKYLEALYDWVNKYIYCLRSGLNKFFKAKKKDILSYTFEEHQFKRKYWLLF